MTETEINLIKQAKEKCKITWEDNNTNDIIQGIVEEANVVMKSKLGIKNTEDDGEFLKPGRARSLWKEWCLYKWNGVDAEFDEAYRKEIMQARREYEVKYYAEKKAEVQ